MPHYGIVLAILAAFPAASGDVSTGGPEEPKEIKLQGSLLNATSKSSHNNDAPPCRVHVVPMKKGKTYVIRMTRGVGKEAVNPFIPFLLLEDNRKTGFASILTMDGDTGGPFIPQITFECDEDGDYRIVCTAWSTKTVGQGNYQLSIKTYATAKRLDALAGESLLSGKPAPALQGDFALNGKAVPLADLKGKVVLLHFWAVHSADSVALLPRLREWSKKHKAAGLEVIGVTYYNSELGHALRFDPAAGKLKRTERATANAQTDQAMLAAFAAHHQLTHLLLILNKENAQKTFQDYQVDSVPCLVLIDRKGIVRYGFAGEVRARNAKVEKLLTKLLVEP